MSNPQYCAQRPPGQGKGLVRALQGQNATFTDRQNREGAQYSDETGLSNVCEDNDAELDESYEGDDDGAESEFSEELGNSNVSSPVPAVPVSTAKIYKTLKQLFDGKPIQRNTALVPLLPYDADSHGWGESESSSSSSPTPPPCVASPAALRQQKLRGEAVGADSSLSASVADFNESKRESRVALERVRFPQAVFSMTEFVEPVSGENIFEPAAALLTERIRLDDPSRTVDFVVSAGVRGCGGLAHAVALGLGVPYSLSNWYPDGSVGDCRVDRCHGIGGPGWVYLNGVPRHSRVAVVLDVVRTGVTAARLVEGILGIEGCTVLGVYAVGAAVACMPTSSPSRSDPSPLSPADAAAEGDSRLNGYYHHFKYPESAAAAGVKRSQSVATPGKSLPLSSSSYSSSKALVPPPPLRALYIISLAGELTHVLTRGEREAAWCTFSQAQQQQQQQRHTSVSDSAAAVTPRVKRAQQCLVAQYERCFPLECPNPRRLPSNAANAIKRMPAAELQRKQRRVAASFAGVPIIANTEVGGYPYCFFALTDFKPALEPSLVEDMADLAVYFADFRRCEVLVSEGDRGGGPLLHAISLRTHQPYVIASWTLPSSSSSSVAASGAVQVGFGGAHCQLALFGLQPGVRCAFVDDMLSSGGTAEAVLRCMVQLGAVPVEGVFASEKLYPRHGHHQHQQQQQQQHHGDKEKEKREERARREEGKVTAAATTPHALPIRKGYRRLTDLFPAMSITCLAQFVVEGGRTTAPPCRVGE